ncbi:DNA mismatch repair protein MutT [Bacillus mycoides]|uniref:NUDIX hydrolase n=1 Tax=Bacillus sp. FSL R10-2780 TaxID=2954660 RepID=UPI0024A060F6|nr:DNA mismatch repair protein MutT [Bacillus mycoides]
MDYISYLRNMVGHEKVIMVVAGCFVLNEKNEVLLQLRSDNGKWGHPGGFMEFGETVEDTARREVFEETGLKLGKLEFFNVYSGKKYERALSNGDQVALVKLTYICRDFHGTLHTNNEESLQLKFFPLDNLPELWQNQQEVLDDLLEFMEIKN